MPIDANPLDLNVSFRIGTGEWRSSKASVKPLQSPDHDAAPWHSEFFKVPAELGNDAWRPTAVLTSGKRVDGHVASQSSDLGAPNRGLSSARFSLRKGTTVDRITFDRRPTYIVVFRGVHTAPTRSDRTIVKSPLFSPVRLRNRVQGVRLVGVGGGS
jgi:hypothetical protein